MECNECLRSIPFKGLSMYNKVFCNKKYQAKFLQMDVDDNKVRYVTIDLVGLKKHLSEKYPASMFQTTVMQIVNIE